MSLKHTSKEMKNNLLIPRPLEKGDLVKIVSPASIINPEFVEGATRALSEAGFRVEVAPHALQKFGSYAADCESRLADIREALLNPDVRAVLCSRGGYGCVQLLEGLSMLNLRDDPKWLIGFSDVSALHGLMASQNIASVHSSMAKALAEKGLDFAPNQALLHLLTTGHMVEVNSEAHPYNRPGEAEGTLLGGNLAVIQALLDTPFNTLRPESILFIEDIAEPIYKVERIFYQLRLSGILSNIKGLIIGQFTEYRPDANYTSMYDMINDVLGNTDYPVMFNAPIGHVDYNMPILHNSPVRLNVGPDGSVITSLLG